MTTAALFGLSILMNFVASGILTKLYILPRLRVMNREEALLPLGGAAYVSFRRPQLPGARGRIHFALN